jgi:hypothetical protein
MKLDDSGLFGVHCNVWPDHCSGNRQKMEKVERLNIDFNELETFLKSQNTSP